jgi:hypothetical protein
VGEPIAESQVVGEPFVGTPVAPLIHNVSAQSVSPVANNVAVLPRKTPFPPGSPRPGIYPFDETS